MNRRTLFVLAAIGVAVLAYRDYQNSGPSLDEMSRQDSLGPPEISQNFDEDTEVLTVRHWAPLNHLIHGLRLRFEMDGGQLSPLILSSWHFFDAGVAINRVVVDTDTETFELPETLVGDQRWHHSGQAGTSVIESLRVPVTGPEEIAAVRRLANASSATILFQGSSGSYTLALYPRQLESMRLLLQRYDELSGRSRH